MSIQKVGIIGAGQMGNGIAHVCATAGLEVRVTDISAEALDRAMGTIHDNMARLVSKGRLTEAEMEASLARITSSSELDSLAGVDLAIESATEEETIKRKIFQSLCPLLDESAILATNTSSISITRLAASTDRPEQFIGLHFMNPVPLMQLVELIRGIATND
ncbi:MAG: 3-hydroxyacyl-CoA dehydrogenase NAD-binding domain-containing protein, partial [Pseudomonadota bacterium]